MLFLALLCTTTTWATDYNVKNDSELREAIANDGANITVTADIDLSNSTLEIKANTTVTINLNGYTLDRQLTQRGEGGGQVITVRSGATLHLSNGTLKGGWGGNGGGIANEDGTANLTNVTITGCVGDDRGGGIVNGAGGTLTLKDCTITGNITYDKTTPKGGGGIFNAGTLNMQGTNIINDNWKPNGMRSNLYLKSGTVINITGDLEGSHVFVDMETLGTFTSGYSTYHDIHPAGFFTADKGSIRGMKLVAGEAQLSNAIPEGGVYYIERSWNETAKRVEATYRVRESYTTLTGGSADTYLDPGWYVVKGSDIEYSNFIYMNGDGEYHLILCDGASLKAEFFIVNSPNVLHIHGQANDTGKMSNTFGSSVIYIHKYHAGIGGYYDKTNGTIVIHGGDIDVHGGDAGPGIGNRSHETHGDPITIYGGTVHAKGGIETGSDGGGGGAGIGGGWNGDCGIVNIYGGSVYATGRGNSSGGAGIGSGSWAKNGGTITIYGGYVEATGDEGGAGIGSGYGTSGADVTIHGGTVKAYGKVAGPGIGTGVTKDDPIPYTGSLTVTGGKVYAYGAAQRGAGIGGGWSTNGSNVTISGGYVYAEGGKYASGIGSGCEHDSEEKLNGGTLTVTGGYVEAHGGEDGAGIGGGEDADGGTINISGGEVRAYGNDYGAGIGGGENGTGGNVTITGGIVIAESGGDQRAIGAGYGSTSHGSLTFADNLGVFVTTDLYRSVKANRVIDCRNFAYVRINQCGHGGATISIVDGEKHAVSGCNYCYAGDEAHTFGSDGECAACHLISLANNADNSRIIAHWDGSTDKAVTLSGRTLSKGGSWNTLCLPFDVTLAGSPLAGATLKELDVNGSYGGKQTGLDNGTLNLYFKDAASIEAGKPYIVKWDSGDDVTSPVFTGVTFSNALSDVKSTDGNVSFKGVYDPQTLTGGDKSNLFMGSDNRLYWPDADVTINACRAFFHLNDDVDIREFNLNLDGNATGIKTVYGLPFTVDSWYDLQGRKVQSTAKKGVYILNGKKVVIK